MITVRIYLRHPSGTLRFLSTMKGEALGALVTAALHTYGRRGKLRIRVVAP